MLYLQNASNALNALYSSNATNEAKLQLVQMLLIQHMLKMYKAAIVRKAANVGYAAFIAKIPSILGVSLVCEGVMLYF